MKKYNLITPEGTHDLLYEECTAIREIESKLMGLFSKNGFHEVVTPLVEFYDVFGSSERSFPLESVYKLNDIKGRQMVLRPDSTLPIIRLADIFISRVLGYNTEFYDSNLLFKIGLTLFIMLLMFVPIFIINKYFPFIVGRGKFFSKKNDNI